MNNKELQKDRNMAPEVAISEMYFQCFLCH